ncbi:hypothetical protein L873DRAFT_809350 [Choiromyces venosus 120613-1]|uniref:Uncharacterized protein n=1 Tax=Choiromyces venosus 120613-1 TaxID=1336337 RepID=A0A3N4JSY7_9PEZI|nr:hypothetical protein L873DRAFT_809350 [Choiromyces venosus 120613-1]
MTKKRKKAKKTKNIQYDISFILPPLFFLAFSFLSISDLSPPLGLWSSLGAPHGATVKSHRCACCTFKVALFSFFV